MHRSIGCLCLLSAVLTGCTNMKIATESNPDYAFDAVETFAWKPVSAEVIEQKNVVLNKDLQKALNNELVQHGWTQVAHPEQADLHVSYYLTLEEQQQYSSNREEMDQVSGGFVYNTERRSWQVNEQNPDLNVYTVEIGTATLGIHDADTGERIWTGTLKTKIDRTRPPDKQYEFFRTIARKLIVRLP